MMIPSDYICRNGADDTADLFCFRDFIDDNPDVLGIYDENGCFVAGNSAFMTLFGQEPPLVLSHFPLKNASRVSNVIQTDDVVTIPLYRYSQGLRYDVEKIGHDYADLHITIYPVGNRGNETLFLCAVHDKNDDLHTAEEYKKATRICHDLFDVPDSAVFICNRAGILTFYSPVMDKIPGIPQDNVPGRHFLEFIHEKDRKHMSGKFNQALGGAKFRSECVMSHGDDADCRIRISAGPMKNNDRTTGIYGLIRFIRSRKMCDTCDYKNENQYHSLYRKMREGVVLIEIQPGEADSILHFTIMDANPAFLELFNADEIKIRGSNEVFFEKCFGEMYPILSDKISKVISTGKPESFELFTPLIGKTLSISVFSTNDTGYGIFFNDITDRKRLESHVFQARKMETVGQLAGGIAHDFNNILTAIIGNADCALMKMNIESEFYQEMKEIKETGERAADLTRHLLAFSRRQVVAPRILNLNTVLGGIRIMLRRLIVENIDLKLVMEKCLWNICIDPGQVEQLLTNLIVNSRDAMPDGGQIIIETANILLDNTCALTHPAHIPGEYVMLSVSDTGIGMDEETKSRIFEPFFTTKSNGTGFGLSTCYGIVKQNNGTIWAYSEPGLGTTMKIYLPRVIGVNEDCKTNDVKTSIDGGSETILLVEDDPVVMEMLSRLLREYGYHVLKASDGRKALDIVKKNSKDTIGLVVTDVVMPYIGGKDLSEKLKKRGVTARVLFMSGYPDETIVRKGILEPGIDFIHKPISSSAFLRKVRNMLDS